MTEKFTINVGELLSCEIRLVPAGNVPQTTAEETENLWFLEASCVHWGRLVFGERKEKRKIKVWGISGLAALSIDSGTYEKSRLELGSLRKDAYGNLITGGNVGQINYVPARKMECRTKPIVPRNAIDWVAKRKGFVTLECKPFNSRSRERRPQKKRQ